MKILLDTQLYLWVLADSSRLRHEARELIQTADEVYVSAASVWEACIKVALGRLEASPEALMQGISASGFMELPILAIHSIGVAELPPIHRDPFDRLLVAQARAAALTLLTSDRQLSAYADLVPLIQS